MVLLSEFGPRPIVGSKSAAATLLFGSICVFDEGGGGGMRVAVASVFAVILAGFALVVK
jgi:hypothetical protein